MKPPAEIPSEDIDRLHERLDREAEAGGYHLNPDRDFTRDLARSLLVNERRFGYPACPCRLASADKAEDLDIICPCDYRDPDLAEFGACYCGLYVSDEIKAGTKPLTSIPERRPPDKEQRKTSAPAVAAAGRLAYPVWRCKVCGYLCARGQPPGVCPVCKAKKDRFERFL